MGMSEWGNGERGSHRISFLNQEFHDDVLVLDVDDGCHGFSLRPHEGGAKDHAQIARLHQIPFRVGGDTGITRQPRVKL